MSYCRWSSDDFQCDIYCYAHCDGGYAVHVASNKIRIPLPAMVEWKSGEDNEAWFKRHAEVMRLLDKHESERKPIGLPFDGEHYYIATAKETADKLEELRKAGYNVPEYAIEALREEAKEETTV